MLHFHKYKIVNAQQGTGMSTSSLTLEQTENIPITSILYRCEKCGKVKVKNIEGKWDITSLTN